MPADWYSPALDFCAAAAWPAAFLFAVWLFRRPLGRFIDEITQFEGFGAKATRSGNQLSRSLRQDALEDLGEAEVPEALSVELEDGEADAEATSDVRHPIPAQQRPEKVDVHNETEVASTTQLLQFVGDQIYQKLLKTLRQHDTRSAAVSAELVRTAYSDLRLGVRYLGLHRLGFEMISGSSWPLASSDAILRRLGAPQEQIVLTRNIRRLEAQVKSKEVQVNGSGARDFIQTSIDIHMAIYSWAGIEVRATRRRQ